VLILGAASGLTLLTLALSPNLPLALLATMGMGASQAGFMVLFHTIVQSIVPDSIRGRISALNNLHISGLMASFNLVNGSLAEVYSAAWILGAMGAAFLVVILLSFVRMPLRRLYTAGAPGVTAVGAVV